MDFKTKKIVANINAIDIGHDDILYDNISYGVKFESYHEFTQSVYFCDILNLHNMIKVYNTDLTEAFINCDNVIEIVKITESTYNFLNFKNTMSYMFMTGSNNKLIEIEKYIRNKKLKELLDGI